MFDAYSSFLSDGFDDAAYYACCYSGGRCKAQRLRSNVPGMRELECEYNHAHDFDEWTPKVIHGTLWFPSSEEPEYTAELSFNNAMKIIAWAVKTNRMKRVVPSLIRPIEVGSRRGWPQFYPTSSKSDMMCAVGFRLGLAPSNGEKSFARIPPIMCISECQEVSPQKSIYCGQGNATFGLAATHLSSTLRLGIDGGAAVCMQKYARWLQGQPELSDNLHDLCGRVCLTDLECGVPRPTEVLIEACMASA